MLFILIGWEVKENKYDEKKNYVEQKKKEELFFLDFLTDDSEFFLGYL